MYDNEDHTPAEYAGAAGIVLAAILGVLLFLGVCAFAVLAISFHGGA